MAYLNELEKLIFEEKWSSAWRRGVLVYAHDLYSRLKEAIISGHFNDDDIKDRVKLADFLLDGAKDWETYSYSGNSLCYNEEIARRLSTPSELKRTDDGRLPPNRREDWLQCQGRALYQAACFILAAARRI